MEGPKLPYYSLAWGTLFRHYNGPLWWASNCLTIALHLGIYLAIIMVRYGGPQTSLPIALHGSLYIAIVMVRYGGPQISLNLALHLDLY
jgi:hypothetical protein